MKKQTIIILSVLAAVAAIALIFYKPFLKWYQARRSGTVTTETMEGVKITPGLSSWPLQKGKQGVQVLYFQAFLNMFRGATIETLDGVWGNETERECNDHFKLNKIDQSTYSSYILPHYAEIAVYLTSKGIKA